MAAILRSAAALGFGIEDQVACMFCGVHKTIAVGLPLIALIFEATPERAATITVPLMIYHPTQLVLGSLAAGRLAARITVEGRAPGGGAAADSKGGGREESESREEGEEVFVGSAAANDAPRSPAV